MVCDERLVCGGPDCPPHTIGTCSGKLTQLFEITMRCPPVPATPIALLKDVAITHFINARAAWPDLARTSDPWHLAAATPDASRSRNLAAVLRIGPLALAEFGRKVTGYPER